MRTENEYILETVNVDELKIHPLNPNVMDKPTFLQLKKNIAKYGYNEPIVCARWDNEIWVLDGAHRALALQELAIKEIDVIIVKDLPVEAIWAAPLAYNTTRGKLDHKKIGEFLINGETQFTKEVLQKWTTLDKQKYEAYTALIDDVKEIQSKEKVRFVPTQDVAKRLVDTDMKTLKNVKDSDDVISPYTFYLNGDDRKYVTRMMDEFKKYYEYKSDEDTLIAIIGIAEHILQQRQKEQTK